MVKRNKGLTALLLPVFVVVFVVGWVMYWAGDKPVKTKPVEEFKFTFLEAVNP